MKNIITESYKKLICESDGWNDQVCENLYDILNEIEQFKYEIDHCVKGSYSGVKTHTALAEYIRNLADELNSAADGIEDIPEDEDEEVEEESSVEMPTDTDNVITDTNNINKKYIIMCGKKFVSSPITKLTENPNLAAVFTGIDEANAAKAQCSSCEDILTIVSMDELFTNGKYDEDKANIYFKYNKLYESIQKKNNKKLI